MVLLTVADRSGWTEQIVSEVVKVIYACLRVFTHRAQLVTAGSLCLQIERDIDNKPHFGLYGKPTDTN